MDTTTRTTIVLVLLWLYLCCQALGFLLTLINVDNSAILPITTALSTILLGTCLWQCKKAGYLVSPMTWYHWILLVLLVLLQVMAVVMEYFGLQGSTYRSLSSDWTYPIYGVAALLVVLLGGTLYCGWKCKLFCRPCCKSQYICYGSAIVVVLVLLVALGATAVLSRFYVGRGISGQVPSLFWVPQYFAIIMLPVTQCYSAAVIWYTMLRLPYTVPEVVALLASVLALVTILVLAAPAINHHNVEYFHTKAYYLELLRNSGHSLLAVHLLSLGITWYCLQYKEVFHWPKDYMCFGLLAALVILVALVVIVIAHFSDQGDDQENVDYVKYTLLGYSIVLLVPTLWYAYRCGIFKWCLPKKKNLNGNDTAENTIPETDIAKVS